MKDLQIILLSVPMCIARFVLLVCTARCGAACERPCLKVPEDPPPPIHPRFREEGKEQREYHPLNHLSAASERLLPSRLRFQPLYTSFHADGPKFTAVLNQRPHGIFNAQHLLFLNFPVAWPQILRRRTRMGFLLMENARTRKSPPILPGLEGRRAS